MRAESGAALVRQLMENADQFDVVRRAGSLRDRALLLITGSRDEDLPPPFQLHEPLAAALAGAPRVRTLVLNDDHAFSANRIALGRSLLEWLRNDCGY